MSFVTTERAEIADLLETVGPEAPTMSGVWRTRELAAHLVLREGRLDAAAGIAVGFLASYTDSVQQRIASRPWLKLVRDFRTGPPWYSPFAVPAVGRLANGAEFFVHHEDIRRAQPDWEPRPDDPRRSTVLVATAKRMGRLLYRASPVGVRLQIAGGSPVEAKTVEGRGTVTIVGAPDEVVLHAFGREAVARVELVGAPDDVQALRSTGRKM